MAIEFSPESAHAKEMAKWEMRPTREVTQEMIEAAKRAGVHHGAFEHQEYPKAMYRAEQTSTGIKVVESKSVGSLVEQRNLESRGFAATQQGALDHVEAANFAVAEAAANRAFHDRRLSATARAEAELLDSSTARHLGEIPAAPIKKRGRPARKAEPVSA